MVRIRLSLSGAVTTGAFASPNTNTGISVNPVLSGLSLSNSNYSISGVTSALTADITSAPVTITAAKTYDGSTTLTAGQLTITGVGGQTLGFSGNATLTNPNVGTAALSSIAGTLANGTSGTIGLASNYTLTNPVLSTVTINPVALVVSASNARKVYDSTTSIANATVLPTLSVVSGTLFTNSITHVQDSLLGGSFAYIDANAGTGKTVTVSGASIVNGSTTVTNNYTITYQNNTTSVIERAPLGIALEAVYASSTTITPTSYTLTGLVNNETITGIGNVLIHSPNVGSGNYVSSFASTGGTASLNNYVINSGTNTAVGKTQNTVTLTPVTLTVTGSSVANKTYDATTSATISGGVLVGVIGSDNVTLTQVGNFTTSNAGTAIAVTTSNTLGGAAAGNYVLIQPTGLTANIAPAPVTISGLVANNKVYDGTTDATLGGISGATVIGLIGSDVATVIGSAAGGSFASANVGNAIAITPNLSGLSLSNTNYVISGFASALSANITPKPITISLQNDSKVYGDTTTQRGITYSNGSYTGSAGFQAVGLVGGDTVTSIILSSNGAYATAGVNASPYTITASGAMGNNGLSNYLVSYVSGSLTVTQDR